MSIVTLTMNPTIDESTRVDKVVAERKLRCERARYEPGGGGVNVTRAIRNLGGESLALYLAGGTTGQLLSELLDGEEVKHRAISIDGMTRENLTVTEEDEAQQFRFVMPGPEVTDEEAARVLEEIRGLEPRPDYIVASGSLPPGVDDDFYARVSELDGELGSKVIVDTSGKALKKAVRAGLYLIKPNMREIMDLIGEKVEDESKVAEAAKEMLDRCECRIVVVSMGAGGALLVTSDVTEHIRTPTVPIRSKVGAGDSMIAGMVLGLDRGWAVPDAVRFGIAAGAAAVMTPGTELCRREDTERLYHQMQSVHS